MIEILPVHFSGRKDDKEKAVLISLHAAGEWRILFLFSAIVRDSFLLFSLKEKPKICYMYFNKKPSLDFKKLEKLSAMEPKVVLLNCIFLFNSVQQNLLICYLLVLLASEVQS